MHVGVFGGTFDPVHVGHLVLAEQCREQARLDQVWFIPSARPPHKLDRPLAPFGQRVEMLNLAIAGHAAFRVNEVEKERPGPSYTADTLDLLHQRYPETDLALILGADCLPDLQYWHDPARIVARATLLIAGRPGWTLWSAEELQTALRLPTADSIRQERVVMPQIDIASRDLRQRVREGRSIRYLVPRAVECYIVEHKLYREAAES